MKKIISAVGWLAALIGICYIVFFVPEPTNRQITYAIFYAMVIIVVSIQKDKED